MNYYLHYAIDTALRALAAEARLNLHDFCKYATDVVIRSNKATATLRYPSHKLTEKYSVNLSF